ncbi:MAG: 4'-phosphopantetheinyl transferase superfamily protein [Candidatus Edwardsbacteria bacterium]|nr:4'-phosphopantetheinyl transferase superfamily protein [Candidatus Edwardsbacteria bacterium]
MIIGIGVDVVAIERFGTLKDKESFLAQVLTTKELRSTPKSGTDRYYASLFAAKESVLKALG